MRNPFAHTRTEQETAAPDDNAMRIGQNRYAVPDHTAHDAPYNDVFGWAPSLSTAPGSTPDGSRLQLTKREDFQPDPATPPAQGFYAQRDADDKSRHSAERQSATGWAETKSGFGFPDPAAGANRFKRNPREVPPPESRVTAQMAPRTYRFSRPFMQGLPKQGAQRLNGEHFSMADHRRNYGPILGMHAPKRPGYGTRNTYRLMPAPWDTGLTDMPPATEPEIQVATASAAPNRSRAWRLI